MTESRQEHHTEILDDKSCLTIHHNDGEKYLDEFFRVWDAVKNLKFKGVNPLIANELERLQIKIDFRSDEDIKSIFDTIMETGRLQKGAFPLASLSPENSIFYASEENVKEVVFPILYFKACNSRGEFFAKLVYWGNVTSQHKRRYFGIFVPAHKQFKINLEKSLTVILGRLKQEKEVTQLQTSA